MVVLSQQEQAVGIVGRAPTLTEPVMDQPDDGWTTVRRVVVGLAVLWAALRWVSGAARRVNGPSMEPTLSADQLVLTVPASDRLRVGDVVVVRDPRARERLTVKRIVALAGDVADLPRGPAPVPPGHVAVAGDHRGRSTDSRHYGAVPTALVERRVLLRLLPPGRITPGRSTGGRPQPPG